VREAFRAGRAAWADLALETLLRDRIDEPRVLAAARSHYARTGRLEAFADKLRQCHEAQPADVAVAAQLADVLAELGRSADGSRVLDATRAALADDADLLYEVAHLYDRVGQKSTTEQVLRDVLRLDPSHASAANDLGYTLSEDGRALDEAEALTRRAVDADPANPSFLDSLGWVQYKRGRFDEARQTLERAVAASGGRGGGPDPVVLDHLGDALCRAGDLQAAAGRWKQAGERIASTPNAAGRDDLKALRLQVDRKTRQAESGQPVSVAPLAPAAAAASQAGGE